MVAPLRAAPLGSPLCIPYALTAPTVRTAARATSHHQLLHQVHSVPHCHTSRQRHHRPRRRLPCHRAPRRPHPLCLLCNRPDAMKHAVNLMWSPTSTTGLHTIESATTSPKQECCFTHSTTWTGTVGERTSGCRGIGGVSHAHWSTISCPISLTRPWAVLWSRRKHCSRGPRVSTVHTRSMPEQCLVTAALESRANGNRAPTTVSGQAAASRVCSSNTLHGTEAPAAAGRTNATTMRSWWMAPPGRVDFRRSLKPSTSLSTPLVVSAQHGLSLRISVMPTGTVPAEHPW